MKVLQTIGGFDTKFGGTSTCTNDLMVAIDSLESEHQIDLLAPETSNMIAKGVNWLKKVPFDYKTSLCLSTNLSKFLRNSDYDIYHTNGLWMHVNHETCVVARKKGKPYVITPHGTLYPQALHRNYWKKWPFLKIWFNKDINKSSCIHVTCEDEMTFMRDFGYKGPIALIPNPVGIPDYTEDIIKSRKYPKDLTIGYLGRLHPRKKIENILYGLAKNDIPEANVVIMGVGDQEYEQFLHTEVLRLGLNGRVQFEGFVSGKKKFELLASLSALIVPSEFENFGMIIPEALIVGTPVFTSYGTPWQSLVNEKCGWWEDNSVGSIQKFISELNDMDSIVLKKMGQNGREYIKRKFSPYHVATQMIDLYKWILGEISQPDFIYTN